jgi:hypothetical protein
LYGRKCTDDQVIMKHEVKDEKAGSGFVNDVEKGDDFVAY